MRYPSIYNQKKIGNKVWKITLFKNQIFHDIDAATYKRITGGSASSLDVKVKDAIASDSEDELDGSILYRLIEYRDAKIRSRLQFCLVEDSVQNECQCSEIVGESDNNIDEESKYVYMLAVPETANNYVRKSIEVKMHEYMVRGALIDWYDKMDVPESIRQYSVEEVYALEEDIVKSLRIPSYGRRPPQPFNGIR